MADEIPTPIEPEPMTGAAEPGTPEPATPAEEPAAMTKAEAKDAPKTKDAAPSTEPAPKAKAAAKDKAAPKPKAAHKTKAQAPAPATASGAPADEQPKRPSVSGRRSRRGAEQSPASTPVVRAQAKYVRTSARKARLVCDHIRGKSVIEAKAILAFAPRAVARDWAKLLDSAVANAEHNHELLGEDLRVKEAFADEGPTLKRFRPRAMGRATPIRKRTSHLTITLTPKE